MAALKQWKTRLNSLLGRTLVKRSIRLAGKRPVASTTFDAAIRQVVRSNGWLILTTHDVSETPFRLNPRHAGLGAGPRGRGQDRCLAGARGVAAGVRVLEPFAGWQRVLSLA